MSSGVKFERSDNEITTEESSDDVERNVVTTAISVLGMNNVVMNGQHRYNQHRKEGYSKLDKS